MAFRQCWLAVVLSAPCLVYPATVLEDFESAAADQRWTFSNGQEFPGAKGSFARTREAAHGSGYGGELAFDFEGGGQLNELGVVQGQNGEQGNTIEPRNTKPVGKTAS